MAEDVLEQETPPGETEEPSVDELLAKAKEEGILEAAKAIGYNPDYDGEDKKTALEYIMAGRDIQDTRAKQVRELTKTLDALKGEVGSVKAHFERQAKAERDALKAEIAKLQKERRDAINDADADRVEELDAEIDKKREAAKEQHAPDEPPPEYVEWHKDNKWYGTDAEMTAFANTAFDRIVADSTDANGKPTVSVKRIYDRVRRETKAMFPDKFEEKKADPPPRPAAAAAEVGGNRTPQKQGKQKFTAKDLTDEAKRAGREFVAMNLFKDLDAYAQATLGD